MIMVEKMLLQLYNESMRPVIVCLCVSLVGCSVAFDTPPSTAKDIDQEASAKVISDLKSTSEAAMPDVQQETQAKGKLNPVGETATGDISTSAIGASENVAGTSKKTDAPASTNTPVLRFERVAADMPQLAVHKGLDKGTILVDGEKISLGGMTKTGLRIGLIAPGYRNLRVECPFDPPFSANFYVEKGDRIVLHGNCSSQQVVKNALPTTTARKDTNANIVQNKEATIAAQIGKKPILLFSRNDDKVPRLMIKGITDAVVFIDDEKINWKTGSGVANVTIQPGHHSLRVLSQAGSPFSADFFVEKGDTVTLCGDCVDSVADTKENNNGVLMTEQASDLKGVGSTTGSPGLQGTRKTPVLSFSKVDAGPPQLSIHEMGNAVVIFDGRKIGTDGVMGVDRMMTIKPGSHTLEVIYQGEVSFKASFYIEAGERATLRGSSSK